MATHSSVLPSRICEQRSLAGYRLRGHKELDPTEWLMLTYFPLSSVLPPREYVMSLHSWRKRCWYFPAWIFILCKCIVPNILFWFSLFLFSDTSLTFLHIVICTYNHPMINTYFALNPSITTKLLHEILCMVPFRIVG